MLRCAPLCSTSRHRISLSDDGVNLAVAYASSPSGLSGRLLPVCSRFNLGPHTGIRALRPVRQPSRVTPVEEVR